MQRKRPMVEVQEEARGIWGTTGTGGKAVVGFDGPDGRGRGGVFPRRWGGFWCGGRWPPRGKGAGGGVVLMNREWGMGERVVDGGYGGRQRGCR